MLSLALLSGEPQSVSSTDGNVRPRKTAESDNVGSHGDAHVGDALSRLRLHSSGTPQTLIGGGAPASANKTAETVMRHSASARVVRPQVLDSCVGVYVSIGIVLICSFFCLLPVCQ